MLDGTHYILKIHSVVDYTCMPSDAGYPLLGSHYTLVFFAQGGSDKLWYEGGSFSVKKHDILFLPPCTEGVLHSHRKGRMIFVHFLLSDAEGLQVAHFTPQEPEIFVKYFKRLCEIWRGMLPGRTYAACATLNRILEHIVTQSSLREAVSTSPVQNLDAVLAYINVHFADEALYIGDLAKRCNVSENYFRRIFRARTGSSPKAYIEKLRTELALRLLSEGNYTVREVAALCGIDNAKYFSKFIKARTGSSPSDFK